MPDDIRLTRFDGFFDRQAFDELLRAMEHH